jgi:hypothetical protein
MQRQQQQQRDGMPEGTASGCGKEPAVAEGGGASPSAERIQALVNRYSYMTKFVALLNPGKPARGAHSAWHVTAAAVYARHRSTLAGFYIVAALSNWARLAYVGKGDVDPHACSLATGVL